MYTHSTKLMTDVMKVLTVHDHWETFWWGMYLFGEGLKDLDVLTSKKQDMFGQLGCTHSVQYSFFPVLSIYSYTWYS